MFAKPGHHLILSANIERVSVRGRIIHHWYSITVIGGGLGPAPVGHLDTSAEVDGTQMVVKGAGLSSALGYILGEEDPSSFFPKGLREDPAIGRLVAALRASNEARLKLSRIA